MLMVTQTGGDRELGFQSGLVGLQKPMSLTTRLGGLPMGSSLRGRLCAKASTRLSLALRPWPTHSVAWTSSLVDNNPSLLDASCSPCVCPGTGQVPKGLDQTAAAPQQETRHHLLSRGLPPIQSLDPASAAGTASTWEARSWLRGYSGHRSPTTAPGP